MDRYPTASAPPARRGGFRRQLVGAGLAPVLALALAGCGDDSTDVGTAVTSTTSAASASTSAGNTSGVPAESSTTSTPRVRGTSSTVAGAPNTTVPPASTTTPAPNDQRVAAARQDLQRRFGYSDAEIKVVGVEEEITWPNTALGCPANDKVYAQTLVPGYRIVLSWKTTTFKYHGADGELPFLCEFLD